MQILHLDNLTKGHVVKVKENNFVNMNHKEELEKISQNLFIISSLMKIWKTLSGEPEEISQKDINNLSYATLKLHDETKWKLSKIRTKLFDS